MLGAIALHRTAFSLALIVAFSVWLAGVLTGIGIALVCARGLFEGCRSTAAWRATSVATRTRHRSPGPRSCWKVSGNGAAPS
jgi:hypothetical protein